jgi:hypothetical protein
LTWEISTCSGRIPQVEIENNKIIAQKQLRVLFPKARGYLIPQEVPGLQEGIGNALALAVIVVVAVGAVFVASM